MCLQLRRLENSHLIPKALHKNVDDPNHKPVALRDSFLLPTNRQTQTYLLCRDCENILSREGETWIGGKFFVPEGGFPLYEALIAQGPPEYDERGLSVYSTAKNPNVKSERLVHLALGIFWKASVHSWRPEQVDSLIDLGPYAESIRKWLRGEDDFPKDVHLTTILARPQNAVADLTGPYETRDSPSQGWHMFMVHLCGLFFMLNVGKRVSEMMRFLCTHNNPFHPVCVSTYFAIQHRNFMAGELQNARQTRAFKKAMEKIRKERS